ncbi:hypothetical protein Calhy_1096 [Caldicellulosiruptor hydrothermalis 108]|uniref:Zorya protein ZorC EH domain-containing protein n=1 Tax=Caldicellulosiruptor hydrothermalis (strain DSM 18901 / VKM B-2411 / 108) TaxID=632292 RepID=E4Q8H4_CALH1|nr:hypothetical protein [Caldicellulosiruptor hydrothermalis]ADQ06819.1 hypothetical protein Calhy_1096 [Caldicellulosiruptor hydrothermalis 108]
MKKINIPTLDFYPFKLSIARRNMEATIEKVLGEIENPAIFEFDKNFSSEVNNLIEALSKITSDYDLLEFSYKIKLRHVRLLLSYLSSNYDKIEHTARINIIKLTWLNPKISLFKQLWSTFQTLYSEPAIMYALKFYFKKFDHLNKLIGISEREFFFIKQWIDSGAEINKFVEFIIKENISLVSIKERFSIKDDKPLFIELCWNVAITAKSTHFFSDTNNIKYICDMLEKTNSIEKLAQFYNHYLTVLDIEHCDRQILEILVDRFGEPNKPKVNLFWNLLDENVKQKLLMWLNEQKLLLFFSDDNERFSFWKRFIKYMEYVYPDRQNYRVFMYFKNIVVIEFGNVGNAIYAYSKDYFKSAYEVYISLDKSNDFFKDKNTCLFRITHQTNWKYKTFLCLRYYENIE